MKKRILIILGVVSVLGMTGCFEKKKTYRCNANFDEYGEQSEVTAKFVNSYLSQVFIKTITNFDDEEMAKVFYDMYKDSEDKKVYMKDNSVFFEKTENFDWKQKESNYSIDNYIESLKKQGYECYD